MIRQVASFREEYVKKRNQSQIDAPGTKYLAEREEARQKAAEAAKRPAQAMSSTRSKWLGSWNYFEKFPFNIKTILIKHTY